MLPRLRIEAISADLFALVKKSAMRQTLFCEFHARLTVIPYAIFDSKEESSNFAPLFERLHFAGEADDMLANPKPQKRNRLLKRDSASNEPFDGGFDSIRN